MFQQFFHYKALIFLEPPGGQVFRVLDREGINVKMISQGASKTNISLIVGDGEGQRAIRAIHAEFFGQEDVLVATAA